MTNGTMKAVRLHEFGDPKVLRYEDAPIPRVKAGEVLVRVHAVGLNPPDWYLRDGYKMLPPEWQPLVSFPLILGTDISGVVAEVPDDVDAFSVGDEVYAMVRFPAGINGESRGYAEYVSVPVDELAHKPTAMDHIQAAGAPMSLLTAWQFLVDQGLSALNPLQAMPHRPVPLAGRTVLVNGAAGGVGHFGVQIAKLKGARVIAVASSAHSDFLRSIGADEVWDYTRTAPEESVRDIDLVLDTVGGSTTGRFLQTLKPGGALFPVFPLGFTGADDAAQRGFVVSTAQVRSSGAQLQELATLIDAGSIRTAVDSTFPLSDAASAHERAARGHIRGKIVLTVR